MKLIWERISHTNQRYDTVGDWQEQGGALWISTSILPDFRSELAVAMHEAVEALLCKAMGITAVQVDAFDIHGAGKDLQDPGNSPAAPYHTQHMLATVLEKLVCQFLGLPWEDHEFFCDHPVQAGSPALQAEGTALRLDLG